ncbi:MAG: hypothetical protein WKF55_03345 [Gemmatimonadaceae bacterium]
MKRYPAEALQSLDHRRNVRKQCVLLDLTARQELEDVVARLEDLLLNRFSAAHYVTNSLVALARNSHRSELTRSIEASEVGGISLVVFSLDTRSLRKE